MGLVDVAEPGARELGHVDGGKEADRERDQHRDQRDHQRAGEERDCAEGAGAPHLIGADGRLRAPLQAEQEVPKRDDREEADRFEQHREDDANGGDDGDAGGEDEDDVHHPLHLVARAQAGRDAAPGPAEAGPAEGHADREHRGVRGRLHAGVAVCRRLQRRIDLAAHHVARGQIAHVVEQQAHQRLRLLRHQGAEVGEKQRLQDRRLDDQPDDEDDTGRNAAPERHVPAVVARHGVELAEVGAGRAKRPAAAEIEADDHQHQDRDEEDGELHAVGRPCTLRPVRRAPA